MSASLLAAVAASGSLSAGPAYHDDLAFLKKHTEIVELFNDGGQRIAVAPAWQGRVMTSTASGGSEPGFGWINREVIAQGIRPEEKRTGLQKHIHVFGGEERFWLGPEGGPFALFFPPHAPQTFDNWKTPAFLDTEPFEIVEKQDDRITFSKKVSAPSRAGVTFDLQITRAVGLHKASEVAEALGFGVLPENVRAVGYETENTVKNIGKSAWTRETGAPFVWLLGMFKPTPRTTIAIPFKSGSEAELGPVANTNYAGFSEIPPDRVKLTENVLFFKGDGKARGKLGIKPKRGASWAGSWQPDLGVLTLIKADLPAAQPASKWPYADSQWKEGGDPFDGDVMNAYNDGPPEPGAKPLGPFFELESCSPALLLAPGEAYTHTQHTYHLTGPREALNSIAEKALNISLDEIEKALPR